MNHDRQHDIALMRYRAIAPLIAGLDESSPSRNAFYEAVSAKGITDPDGKLHHFAPATIERWFLSYNKFGFDALLHESRTDADKSHKLDPDLQEHIRYLKTNYPRMSAAAIHRQLFHNGSLCHGQVSESTVCRFLNQLMLELGSTPNRDMRRYERPHINEVWCGDSSFGPRLTDAQGRKRRVYIIALIDDASRLITGIDIFYNDNFRNLMAVLRSAVAKYGRPKVLNFDNGKSYRNKQMQLLAARVCITLSYCHPYTPTSKAKIKRWFRTMKDQWVASLDMWDFHSLEELRGSLLTFVHQYNLSSHSSLQRKSSQDRIFQEPEQIRRLSGEQLERDFLLEIEQRVSADSVIFIEQVEYEVDYRLAKQRICLCYSPDMKQILVSEPSSKLTPIQLLNKQENAQIKREKVRLCLVMELGGQPAHRKVESFRCIRGEINRLVVEKHITPVIIVDEANYISGAILNDLKLLFNFEVDSRDKAVILLAGLPSLNNTLRLGIHEPLRQRIVMNYDLGELSKEEGRSYIQAKLDGDGCQQRVFEEDALEAVLNAANGTPHLI